MALTATGLQVPTYEETLASVVQALRANVSSTIDVSDDTALGQMNKVFSAELALAYQGLQDVYDQRNILVAEGKALDDAISWLGLLRQGATATAGIQHFTGNDGTILSAGSFVQNSISKETYTTDALVFITKDSCRSCRVSVQTVDNEATYTVTINGVVYSFTSSSSASALEIVGGIALVINGASGVPYAATTDGSVLVISATTTANITVSTDIKLRVSQVTVAGSITGVNTGALAAPANSVTGILSPTSGWVSTINPVALVLGRARETDDELRLRAINFRASSGKATLDAIRSAVLNVAGVSGVAINERLVSEGVANSVVTVTNVVDEAIYQLNINGRVISYTASSSATADEITAALASAINTAKLVGVSAIDNADSTFTVVSPLAYRIALTVGTNLSALLGQNAGSIHLVISGGLDNNELAQTIWDNKAGGVEVWAVDSATKVSGTAVDSAGNTHLVSFNRPAIVSMVVSVNYKVFDVSVYPQQDADAYAAIKSAVTNFGNLIGAGDNVVPNEFLGAVYNAVRGIYDVEVIINGESSDDPTNFVPIAADEVAVFEESTVTVIRNT